MTSFKKNDTRPVVREESLPAGSQKVDPRLQLLIDHQAEEIVAHVHSGIKEVCQLVYADEVPDSEVSNGLVKEVIYNCLALTSIDPFFSETDRLRNAVGALEDCVCSYLFRHLFDQPATGSEFEYFGCIFKTEYQQVAREIREVSHTGLEGEEKGLNVIRVEKIVAAWLGPRVSDVQLRDEVTKLIEGLCRSILVKMSRALLS